MVKPFYTNRPGILLALASLCLAQAGVCQTIDNWSIDDKSSQHQVDILLNHQLITSFCYYDSIRKPILFPINTLTGQTVTRNYPIKIVPGETADHPHHVGLWLNYEFVNGLDFWNNSTAIPLNERRKYGTIVHDKVISSNAGKKGAELVTSEHWLTPDKTVLLDEQTQYVFARHADRLIIDRITTLTARTDVSFKDTKDGMIAIRVARQLEQPIKGEREMVDDAGEVVKKNDDGASVTGLYLNSEGLTGDACWGVRARWCMLSGKINGQDISIAIIDHPRNVGYPTYWHARGYGLFAANPLGQEVFSKGKEKLDFKLMANKSETFRYRIIICSGPKASANEIARFASDFSKLY